MTLDVSWSWTEPASSSAVRVQGSVINSVWAGTVAVLLTSAPAMSHPEPGPEVSIRWACM